MLWSGKTTIVLIITHSQVFADNADWKSDATWHKNVLILIDFSKTNQENREETP